jgi:carbon storage regulator
MTMLVLTRRVGETIVVDGEVRISVVSVNGNKIRLSIDAPPYVRVDREEIHKRRAEFVLEH